MSFRPAFEEDLSGLAFVFLIGIEVGLILMAILSLFFYPLLTIVVCGLAILVLILLIWLYS